MALVSHLALVPWQVSVDLSALTRVAAALQRQLTHFGGLWNVEATIAAFAQWDDVPGDYWRITLVDDTSLGQAGKHGLTGAGADVLGQPFSLVAYRNNWSMAASHECLEMLADPSGSRTVVGPSPNDAGTEVEFLVEVCDPCQATTYSVDGVPVCDFCTPAYYHPAGQIGTRYSYCGSLSQPFEVIRGGYVSWRDPRTGSWWRRDWIGDNWTDLELGPHQPDLNSIRGALDRRSGRRRPSDRGVLRLGPAAAPPFGRANLVEREIKNRFGPAAGPERPKRRRRK